MVEKRYEGEEKTTSKTGAKVKIPKNIRQIGRISDKLRIYVEDYVKTYARQLAEGDYTERCVAVLVGEYTQNEIGKSVFIYGAVEAEGAYFDGKVTFNEEIWATIYGNIKKYFPEGEIVGWYYGGTGFGTEDGDMIKQVHIDNFSGRDKVLLTYDVLEKEDNFYLFENGTIMLQPGYYIYYEKNLEMQAYMVDHKEVAVEEKEVDDHAIREIRSILDEKKKPARSRAKSRGKDKDQKSIQRLVYTAGGLVAAVVLIVGVTVVYNNQRIKGIETSVSDLVKNITGAASVSESANIFDRAEENSGNRSIEASTNSSSVLGGDDKVSNAIPGESEGNSPLPEEGMNEGEQTVKAETPVPTQPTEVTPVPTEEADKTTNNSILSEYVVEKGDTLANICFRLYGDYKNVTIIKEINRLEDENKIYVGQKLLVP